MVIENIIIGKPLCEPHELLALNISDWNDNESKLTHFTETRFLPDVLRECELTKESNNWFRKNKPELLITLDKFDFIQFKLGKKKSLITVLVGE